MDYVSIFFLFIVNAIIHYIYEDIKELLILYMVFMHTKVPNGR